MGPDGKVGFTAGAGAKGEVAPGFMNEVVCGCGDRNINAISNFINSHKLQYHTRVIYLLYSYVSKESEGCCRKRKGCDQSEDKEMWKLL